MKRFLPVVAVAVAGLALAAPAQAATWHLVKRDIDVDSAWGTSAYVYGGTSDLRRDDDWEYTPQVVAARVRITAPRGRTRWQVDVSCRSRDGITSVSKSYRARNYRTTRRRTVVLALPTLMGPEASCDWTVDVDSRPGTLRVSLELLA
jgi:hypothetical protein